MVVGRGARGALLPWILKILAKSCFLSFEWEKTNFATVGHPKKNCGKIPYWPCSKSILPDLNKALISKENSSEQKPWLSQNDCDKTRKYKMQTKECTLSNQRVQLLALQGIYYHSLPWNKSFRRACVYVSSFSCYRSAFKKFNCASLFQWNRA